MTAGLALACAVGCQNDRTPPPEPAPARIGAAMARKLALGRYRELFAQAYHRDGDAYQPFPQLSEEDFTQVEVQADAWKVRCEPPVGYYVVARVGLAGDWVELVRVGYANE